MSWWTGIVEGVAMIVSRVVDRLTSEEPELSAPPPPSHEDDVVRDIEAARQRKFGRSSSDGSE